MSEPFCLTEDILVVYICECIYASKNTRMRVYGVCTSVVYVCFYVTFKCVFVRGCYYRACRFVIY